MRPLTEIGGVMVPAHTAEKLPLLIAVPLIAVRMYAVGPYTYHAKFTSQSLRVKALGPASTMTARAATLRRHY